MARIRSNLIGMAHYFNKDGKIEASAAGTCLFGNFFNHSCDLNIHCVCYNNKIAFVTNRPIKAGEQLFISYIDSFPHSKLADRKKKLSLFGFKCKCMACVNDWPMENDLPRKTKTFKKPVHNFNDKNYIIGQFKKNCKYLEENWHLHPCYETVYMIADNITLLMYMIHI